MERSKELKKKQKKSLKMLFLIAIYMHDFSLFLLFVLFFFPLSTQKLCYLDLQFFLLLSYLSCSFSKSLWPESQLPFSSLIMEAEGHFVCPECLIEGGPCMLFCSCLACQEYGALHRRDNNFFGDFFLTGILEQAGSQ